MNKTKLKQIEKAFKTHSLNCVVCDHVPDEWWTTREYADTNKISTQTANRQISLMMKSNLLTSRKFRIFTDSDNVKSVVHYCLSSKM